MAMTRKSKVLLVLLALPVVLVLAGIVTLKLVFTSEKLKTMVIPRIEDATHRTVSLNAVSLAFFPSLGLDIDGFTLSNRVGAGFSRSPFVSFDRLHVSVKILPLLKGTVEANAIVIEHPHILIETDSTGTSNYADMTQPAQPSAAPAATVAAQPTKSSSMGLVVSELRIVDGAVDYVDHKSNSATRMQGFTLDMTVDTKGGTLITEGKASIGALSYGTVETPLIGNLALSSDHRLTYDQTKDVLTVEKGNITFQQMSMTLSGTVADLRGMMRLNLVLGAEALPITDLLSLIPKEYMKKAEGLKGNGTVQVRIAVTGTITDSTTADASGTITTSGASIQYPQLPKPVSNITIVSGFTRSKTEQEFHIDRFTANLGQNPISLTMRVQHFDDPTIALTANGSLNLAEVPQFYPLEAGTELAGTVRADVNVAGKVMEPMSMKATGSIAFSGVSVKTAATTKPVRNLNGTITFNNQLVESKNLAMSVGSSDLTLSFWLKNYLSLMSTDKAAPAPTANMTLRSNHLYTADIMEEDQKKETPAAQGQHTVPPAPAAAQGSIQSGKSTMPLPNVDMEIDGTIGTLTMQRFEFSNVRTTMRVSKGTVTLQNFSLNAYDGSVLSKGTLNIKDSQKPVFDFNMNMNNVAARSMLSQFSSFGQRLTGGLTMTASMKGELNDTLGLNPNTLTGSGRVSIQNGTLTGYKVNEALAGLLHLPELDTVRFKDWSNSFAVENGRVIIKDLKITAANADYVVNGSQGMDGSLDYATTLYLPAGISSRVTIAGFAGEAVNAFKDQSGRLRLDFSVGGTTENPRVQLNTEQAKNKLAEMAKQKVLNETQKVQEKVKQKAGDALKGLFRGKK